MACRITGIPRSRGSGVVGQTRCRSTTLAGTFYARCPSGSFGSVLLLRLVSPVDQKSVVLLGLLLLRWVVLLNFGTLRFSV